ncbi:MAG: hypothetical protein ACI83B_003493, partial [Sediminicola sp.]
MFLYKKSTPKDAYLLGCKKAHLSILIITHSFHDFRLCIHDVRA